uniref:DUF7027 domain-containing protein n=1 Tax=Aphidius gifuensis TaxID=684658 RepID=A0A834Y029_APHGI|nr:uncharacterized protein LOC122850191 [Aphidius gifuensis]KAF7995412.1 hypothetical protein HCN44_006519 [Aphidius gifuensis]
MPLVQINITPSCSCLSTKASARLFAAIASFTSFTELLLSFVWVLNNDNHKHNELLALVKIVTMFVSSSSLVLSICLLTGVIMEKSTYMVPWLSMKFGSFFFFGGCIFAWIFTGHLFVGSLFGSLVGSFFGILIFAMYIYMYLVLISYWQLLTNNKTKTAVTPAGSVHFGTAFKNNETTEIP